ncbi:hypothetical protein [Nocardioides sp.]|uniref:hypothetical protein n=1 Tax=Nocardioides sp. TaxID=35761 RepID=UPI00351549F2
MTTAEFTEIVSLAGAVVAVGACVAILLAPGERVGAWWLPALPLAAFTAWSIYAVVDGPLDLWQEHVGTPWETQIWLDLLIMATLVWALAQRRLRALGATRWPWLVLLLATGSIGALSLVLWLNHAERASSTTVRSA